MFIRYTKAAEEWLGVYWHEETKSLLIAYVDDFKLSTKAERHDALWAEVRKVIDMDPEPLDGRFLGCSHERYDTVASMLEDMLDNHPIWHLRPSLGATPQAKARGDEVGLEQRQAFPELYIPLQQVKLVVYIMYRFVKDSVTVFCVLIHYVKV